MFISHKANVIQEVDPDEWQCRRTTKGMSGSEYWAWLATITDSDGVITYPSEDFTIIEVTDENVQTRLVQLGDYTSMDGVYNITWSDSKVSAVTGQDMAGEDITIQTHFSGDDTAKDARLLAEEWTRIRTERTRLLAETDYMGYSDMTMNDAWKVYRQTLRNIPSVQSSKTTYASITWPTKP